MKKFLAIFLLLCSQVACAERAILPSDNLKITPLTDDNDPKSWLRGYIPNNRKELPIRVEFDMDNVRAILIEDVNQTEGKCGVNPGGYILFLSVDPKLNLKQFVTRINKPCLHKGSARLKLMIATGDDKRFYNTSVLTKHPLSSAQ